MAQRTDGKGLSNRRCELEKKLKFFARHNADLGDIVVLQNPATKQRFMMKQRKYHSKEQFNEALDYVSQRLTYKQPNLMHMVDFSSSTKSDDDGDVYTIRLFYDVYESTVRSEITTRRLLGQDFTNEEMTYLLYDSILAAAFLQDKGQYHGEISPGTILKGQEGHFILADRLRHRQTFP